jgi:hypothetical protein
VFIALVPVLVFLGMVLLAELVSEQASPVVVVCAGLFALLLSALSYAMAVLSKLVARVFGRMEEADFFADLSNDAPKATPEDHSLTHAWVEKAHALGGGAHDATCPSCELDIHMTDTHCPRCRASFLEGSPWALIPKNADK